MARYHWEKPSRARTRELGKENPAKDETLSMPFYPGKDVGVIDCQKAYKVFADAAAYKVSQPPVLSVPAS